MRTEREKWLASLRKTIKRGLTAGERVIAQKLYAEATHFVPADGKPAGTGDIPLPEIQPEPFRMPTDFDIAAEQMAREHPAHRELNCLLSLVQPERWMAGSWSERSTGWHEHKTDTDLSFDEAKTMLDARIAELGLAPVKVFAYPSSQGMNAAEAHAFWNASFEQQMRRFL